MTLMGDLCQSESARIDGIDQHQDCGSVSSSRDDDRCPLLQMRCRCHSHRKKRCIPDHEVACSWIKSMRRRLDDFWSWESSRPAFIFIDVLRIGCVNRPGGGPALAAPFRLFGSPDGMWDQLRHETGPSPRFLASALRWQFPDRPCVSASTVQSNKHG